MPRNRAPPIFPSPMIPVFMVDDFLQSTYKRFIENGNANEGPWLWTRMPHFRVCSLRPCYQRLWLDMRLGFCVLGRVAETALNMVVDKPGCLEKRITDRRTEKPESPPFHVPAHGFRLRRNSGNLSQSAEMVNNGLMIGEKRQDVPVKTAEFFLNGHKQFSHY